MADWMIEANGVELCTEAFGDPGAPPVLLIMGMRGSMLWWEDRFCRMLAAGGRFVIRYDHRDTGSSVAYEPGCPGYTAADLVADAAGVLDVLDHRSHARDPWERGSDVPGRARRGTGRRDLQRAAADA